MSKVVFWKCGIASSHWMVIKSYVKALLCTDSMTLCVVKFNIMEELALKNVNNCLNTNIYFYLETFGGQSSSLNLNVVHFFNPKVN
jgi:hypothetical protein